MLPAVSDSEPSPFALARGLGASPRPRENGHRRLGYALSPDTGGVVPAVAYESPDYWFGEVSLDVSMCLRAGSHEVPVALLQWPSRRNSNIVWSRIVASTRGGGKGRTE
jgi:hypothetical protein